MAEYKEYMHIERFGKPEVDGIELGECYVFPKVDGCFEYGAKILTRNGYMRIGQIVKNKINTDVLTYNFKTKGFEWNKILDYYEKPASQNEFLYIRLKGYKQTSNKGAFKCTKNHLLLTANGYKSADKLTLHDTLMSVNGEPNYIQKQMILGTLMGDAHIAHTESLFLSYVHSQSVKHAKYSEMIKKILGRFYSNTRITLGGYAKTKISHVLATYDACLHQYLKTMYKNNKKYFSYKILNSLTPISLAFWYQDDGSTNTTDTQESRVTLHTQGFDKKQINILIKLLYKKFNFKAKSFNYGKGIQLQLNKSDSEIFFILIAPYISEDMQYKIPKKYRTKNVLPIEQLILQTGFYKQKITKISNYTKKITKKYDLSTANENYVISGVIVHNSSARMWLDENTQFQCGSRTRVLSLDKDNAGFMNAFQNEKQFDGIKQLLKDYPNYIVFGEWLCPHTIKTYRAEAWKKFYLYDIFIEDAEKSRYLSYNEYKPLCEKYGIEYIPCLAIVKNGTYENFTHYLTGNNYLIEDGKGTGEGIVLKNYEFRNKWGRQCFAKIVTSEFKEKFHKEMGPNEIEHKTVEDEITEKYCTDAFIDKTKAKIINEVGEWSNKLIPRLIESCFHELIVEETWNILKQFNNPKIDFKTLRHFVVNKVKKNLNL